jgi:hypothetical protein
MDLSMPAGTPAPRPSTVTALTADHRIPGCDGWWHSEGLCENEFGSLKCGDGSLVVTVNAHDGKPLELAVWQDMGDELLRTGDQAEAAAFAAKVRAFADAIEAGADLLAPVATPSAGVAKPEPVDHAARFAALDADLLFDLENQAGDTDAPHAHIESLLIVLAEWRQRIVALLADGPAWSIPEVAAYERALARTREAYLLWSFRWEGGPALPDTFDLPEPVAVPIGGTANVARITRTGHRTLTVRGVAA